MVGIGSNRVDVFPSLHCAASAFMLAFDSRNKPWRYRLYLLPCLGLWPATIYLRYHYLVDCICGFVLFGLAIWIVARHGPTKPPERGWAESPGEPARLADAAPEPSGQQAAAIRAQAFDLVDRQG